MDPTTEKPAMQSANPPTSYTDWVLRVRSVQVQGKNVVIALYHLISEGYANAVWKLGPWQSFERCLGEEFGISPQRWSHLQKCMERFGEERIARYGVNALITMLRLPPASPAEKAVLQEIEEITTSLGRPPGEAVISRLAAKHVPVQRPINAGVTEADRLRVEVRRLQAELRETQGKLRAANRRVESLERALAKKAKKRQPRKQ